MARNAATLRCPSCNGLVLAGSEDFPFCSDRCRRIDLGKWASGAYKITSPILDPDVLESLPERMNAPRFESDRDGDPGRGDPDQGDPDRGERDRSKQDRGDEL